MGKLYHFRIFSVSNGHHFEIFQRSHCLQCLYSKSPNALPAYALEPQPQFQQPVIVLMYDATEKPPSFPRSNFIIVGYGSCSKVSHVFMLPRQFSFKSTLPSPLCISTYNATRPRLFDLQYGIKFSFILS